jgi:AIPR protein
VLIIAKTLKQAGSNFTIEDFQIVNGCQTSNVIFDQRDKLDNTMMIPLRLIASKDEDVIESIVFATNQQTELKPEQLYARTEFAKTLERYFATFNEPDRLYYERRDGQYDRLAVERSRIVSPQNAIRTFCFYVP